MSVSRSVVVILSAFLGGACLGFWIALPAIPFKWPVVAAVLAVALSAALTQVMEGQR